MAAVCRGPRGWRAYRERVRAHSPRLVALGYARVRAPAMPAAAEPDPADQSRRTWRFCCRARDPRCDIFPAGSAARRGRQYLRVRRTCARSGGWSVGGASRIPTPLEHLRNAASLLWGDSRHDTGDGIARPRRPLSRYAEGGMACGCHRQTVTPWHCASERWRSHRTSDGPAGSCQPHHRAR
jgi:hypothetical protein